MSSPENGVETPDFVKKRAELWRRTLKTLLNALTACHEQTKDVRVRLEKITETMSKLKGTVDGMVAAAVVKIESRIQAIDKEILQVKDTADRNKDCGLDSNSGFWDGFLVGFSLGIKCAVTEATRLKARTF